MNRQKLTPQTKKIIIFVAFAFCVLYLTNMTFANPEANKTDTLENTKQESTTKPRHEANQKLNNSQANSNNTNFVQETNTKLHSDFASNLYPNSSPIYQNNSYQYNTEPSHYTNYPNSQTQIYGGSSTIISGNNITTSSSQQNGYPQHQISNNQQNNYQPNNNQHNNYQPSNTQPNHGANNSNSNAGGFYFNMTGPNGSSMSMGTFFGSNSSNNSTVQESTSQIISGNGSKMSPTNAPLRGSNIISE